MLVDKTIFWGVCLVIVLLPLPFGAVDEWAIFAFEAATFVLFVLHLLGAGRAVESGYQAGAAGRNPLPSWLRLIPLLAFGIAVLQIVPLPPSVLAVLSPRAADIWSGISAGAVGAGSAEGAAGAASASAGRGWATISLVPDLTLYELVRYTFYFLFGYLVFKHVRTKRRVEIFALVLFAGACFQAFYGLAEFFGGRPGIFGFEREAYTDSVTGTFINRNHFAGYLEMVFPLSVGYLLAKARFFAMRRGVSLREKLLWFSQERLQKAVIFGVVPVLIGIGIFFSRSRTGIFGFFAALCLMFVALSGVGGGRAGRKEERVPGAGGRYGRVIRTVFVAVVFAVILVGVKPVIERFSFAALSREIRPVYFKNTVEIVRDFPFAGTGLGTYLYAYPAYETTFRGELLDHAHNDYLEFLAEGGIAGGGLLILFGFGALGVLFVRWTRRRDHFVRGVTLGCLAGVASILIHSLTDFNLHITANAVLFVTLYALAIRVVGLNSVMNSKIRETKLGGKLGGHKT